MSEKNEKVEEASWLVLVLHPGSVVCVISINFFKFHIQNLFFRDEKIRKL